MFSYLIPYLSLVLRVAITGLEEGVQSEGEL